jgi:hypothetical protein
MTPISTGDRKELNKVESFREHYNALKRHIGNTGAYLRKEVKVVENKINESKSLMKASVGISIEDMDQVDDFLDKRDREIKIEQLARQEIEEEEEDDVVSI